MVTALLDSLGRIIAAIYARYSTDLQRATSIEDQVRGGLAAAARSNCVVPDDLVLKDAEMSGAMNQRPNYQTLLHLIPKRRFSVIFVEAVDRLSRDQAELHQVLKLCRFHDVRVMETTTGIDLTGRMGRIVATVQGLNSELFLDRLHEEIWRGMEGAIIRGLSAGGRAFGYRSEPIYDPVKKDTYGNPVRVSARRVIYDVEAKVVVYIHQLYGVEGLTPRAIAHRLNHEGVRALNGGSWTPSTIAGSTPKASGILNNPIYIGKVVWNRTRKVRDPITGRRIIRMRPPGGVEVGGRAGTTDCPAGPLGASPGAPEAAAFFGHGGDGRDPAQIPAQRPDGLRRVQRPLHHPATPGGR